jgi:hypothetical protein
VERISEPEGEDDVESELDADAVVDGTDTQTEASDE